MIKSIILEEAEIPEQEKARRDFRWHAEEKALWAHFGSDFDWAAVADRYNSSVITAFIRNETTSPEANALRRAIVAIQNGVARDSAKFKVLVTV